MKQSNPHILFRMLLLLHLMYLSFNKLKKINVMELKKSDLITTLSGLASAILIAWQPIEVAVKTNGGVIDWKNLGLATALAVFGYFANKFKLPTA